MSKIIFFFRKLNFQKFNASPNPPSLPAENTMDSQRSANVSSNHRENFEHKHLLSTYIALSTLFDHRVGLFSRFHFLFREPCSVKGRFLASSGSRAIDKRGVLSRDAEGDTLLTNEISNLSAPLSDPISILR